MTTIALHKYHEQIDKLLNDSHYDLAVEHCRHILQQHPQHIATYRLLAKALLEKNDYAGATELFQRILSADPNDYIAHAGLAVIYKEEDVVSQAIWHLERAYEIEPYNAAIQHELRSLYVHQAENSRRGKQNDDTAVPNASLPLSAGALARFYLRSQLYDQSAALLRATLEKDQERIDLRVLLMEALWRDGRRIEAVNVCLQVLDQLPNCIAANAIIAEIWLRTGRVDEAQRYLQHLQTMLLFDKRHIDRESPEGSAFHVEGAVPLPGVVEVDYLGADLEPREYEEPVGWVSGTAVTPQTEADAGDDDLYQWLEGLTGELPSLDEALPEAKKSAESGFRLDEMTEKETAVSPTTHQSDWLAGLQIAAEEEPQPDMAFATAGIQHQPEKEIEFADLFGEDEDAAAMDWLAASEESKQPAPPGKPAKTQPVSDDLAPDWLADLTQDDLGPIDVDPLTAAVWLREDARAEIEESEDDDEFDWLSSPAKPLPIAADHNDAGEIDLAQFTDFGDTLDEEEDEDAFEWRLTDELTAKDAVADNLDELAEGVEEEVDFSMVALSDDAAEIPDWLMGGSEISDLYDEPKLVTDQLAAELADWVAANNPDLAETDEDFDWFESDEAKKLAEATSEEPDELFFAASSMVETKDADAARALTGTDELPDWLASDVPAAVGSGLLDTHNLADTTVDDQTLADEDLMGSDLPDWLLEEADTAVSPPIQPTDTGDLPDWLMGAALDALDSAPLDETKAPLPAVVEPEADFQPDMAETAVDELGDLDVPVMSDMLRAAVALDLTSEDDFFTAENQAQENLPDWLLPAEETGETLVTASLDVEEVVSDDKDEKITGPQGKQDLPEEPKLPPDDELDWLDDLSALADTASPSIASLSQSDELPDWLQLDMPETIAAETPEDVLETAVPDEPSEPLLSLEEDQELDWLDALATGEPAAETIDELPTWQWPEDQADDLLKDLPDQSDILADEPDLFSSQAADEAGRPTDKIVPEMTAFPDDLDDAMSWLEDLAAEPDAPVEELPTAAYAIDLDNLFAAEEAAEERDSFAPVDETFEFPPDDPEAAMAWLEQLAARQGAPLDELPSITTDAPTPDMVVDDLDTLEMEIPDLDELEQAEAIEESLEPDLFAATLIGAEMVGETAVDDDDLSLAVPDDPDEAMAWLERLAARQGAPLDELPSITAEPAEEASWEAALDSLTDDADALADWDEEWLQEATILAVPADEIAALEPVDEVPDDPEEAMAWLERLAARQGAPLDELPSITAEPAEEASWEAALDSLTDDDADALADWDEEWLQEATILAASADEIAALEPVDEVPDDPEEAMAWLERLAARQGAPLDELPSIERPSALETDADFDTEMDLFLGTEMAAPAHQDDAADLDWDALAGEFTGEPAPGAADELDEAMAWLADLAVDDEPEEIEPTAPGRVELLPVVSPALLAELIWLEEEVSLESDGRLLADADLDEREISDDELAEALAQLDMLAVLPAAEVGAPDVLEEEFSQDDDDWGVDLGTLFAEVEAQDDAALEEFAAAEMVDELIAAEETASLDDTFLETIPDDPDEAMAWLERLAARQGAPLDELPSLADADEATWAELTAVSPREDMLTASLETPEPVEADLSVPDNIDDAMAWLEQLAARQGAPLDELPTVTGEVGDLKTPDWIAAEQTAGEAEAQLFASEAEVDDRLRAAVEGEALDEVTAEETAVLAADDEAAPDNIDDAMAWLERLAARQGASLDELPSVDEASLADDDLGMPDWIVAAQVAAEQESPVAAPPREAAVESDLAQASDEWDDIFQADESTAVKDFESTFAAFDEQDLDLDEVDESLPDWLTTEGEEKSVRVGGHTDWLGSLPEPDLDGWLEAEEQATIAGVPEIEPPVAHPPTGKTGPLSIKRKTGPLPELPVLDEPDFDDDLLMPDLDLGISALELDQGRLASARDALNAGQFDQAINEYAGLVEVGEGLNTLIADLEAAAGRHKEKPLVRRMLGDAYMRNGQLQKALETYRQALDQM